MVFSSDREGIGEVLQKMPGAESVQVREATYTIEGRGEDFVTDVIHFLADKDRIQEEFFHTFNTLYNSQKQIILSADCAPSEIPTLEDRLEGWQSGRMHLI